MKNNIGIGLVLALGLSVLSTPAFAEEAHEGGTGEWTEPETVESTPHEGGTGEITTPEHTDYVPPAEAYEGVGGWAVVNPLTGVVHGVVVCNAAACGPDGRNGGVTRSEYMGCPAGCVYRFQSKAQASGNVVGIHSDGYNKVEWDGDDKGTFSVSRGQDSSNTGTSSSKSTLVPSKTMADGERFDTGFVNTQTKATTNKGVKVDQFKKDYESNTETDILFPEWGVEGKLFQYLSQQQAESNLEGDVDNELILEGYTTEETTTTETTDETTGETTTTTTTETVIDEENVFVKTVREWTQSVVDFFRGIFS